MKIKILTLVVCLISSFILLVGCQKKFDAPADEIAGTPLPTTGTYCRIESIWEHPNTPEQKFYNFIYDEYENPIAITGIPYRTFEYDSWHRLKKYISDYGNGIFGLHHYGYDNQGRISIDTFYIRATSSDHPANYEHRRIITYTYDSQNRIIQVYTDLENTPHDWITSYSYDPHGNQLYPGFCCSVYDNKINVNRTNDVWMFINNDYGRNNRFVANEYNEFGYPTKVKMRGLGNIFADLIDLMDCQISYNCRPSNYY